MIEDIANGAIVDPEIRAQLLACVLVALYKPNGSIRPIAMGEVFVKIAAHYCVDVCTASTPYRSFFPTIQEGVGIPGGCEKVVHSIRAARKAHGPDAIVITVDTANAFNTRRRIDIWNALCAHAGVQPARPRCAGSFIGRILLHLRLCYQPPTTTET